MAAETPTALQGLAVPHRAITSATLDATSTYTQAGPRAGIPEPQADTDLVLAAVGDQTAGTTVQVQARRAGNPGSGAFVWKGSGDASTSWRGWDPPTTVSAFRFASYETGTAEAGARHPHAVTLADGSVLVAFCRNLGGTSSVRVQPRAADGTLGAQVVVHSETTVSTYELCPTLVVLPSGRVLCFMVTHGASTWQIRCEFSDDNGATWATYSQACLRASVTTATTYPIRLRAAYANGEVSLFVLRDAGDANQYASLDLGCSFQLISSYSDPTVQLRGIDVVGVGDGFVVAFTAEWPNYSGSDDRIDVFAFSLGSARTDIFDEAWGPLVYESASTTSTDPALNGWVMARLVSVSPMYADVALVRGDSGEVWLLSLFAPPNGSFTAYGAAAVSDNGGTTWRRLGQTESKEVDREVATTDGFWFQSATDSAYPWRLSAAWHRGRVLLFANADQRTALPTNGNSLYEWTLGGYSTLTLPSVDGADNARNSMVFDRVWGAIETPANHGYTGAGTASTNAYDASKEAWEISTANPNTYVYTATPAIADATGIVVRATMRADAGSARFGFSEAGTDVQAEVTISVGAPTRMFFRDAVAGATLANPAVSSGTWYEVVLWFQSGKVSAWYRAADYGADRQWTALAENQALTGGAGLTDSVYFGAPSGGTNETYWREVQYGTTFARAFATGFTNPDDLRPRPFSGLPTYVDEGVSISATHGPGAFGDEWHIATRYEFGVEHLHFRESPARRRRWRSTGTTAAMSFVWNLDAYDGGLPHGLLALVFDGINFCTADVSFASDAALTWGTPVSLDFRTSFVFERKGSSTRPRVSGSTAAGPYIHRNEAVGGWFQFPNGDIRKIVANTEGWLTSGATVAELRPTFTLEGVDDGEDANGTGYIWWPRAVVLMHHPAAGAAVSALRLRIRPSGGDPVTPEGYFEGKVLIGDVAVFGRKYDHGHRHELRSNVQVTELPSGATRTRVIGPRLREYLLRWDDGQITAQTRGSTQGDYVVGSSTSGAPPVAGARDVSWMVEGLHEELDGPHVPVALLPYIPAGTPDTVTHLWQRQRGAAIVRLGERITLENRRGPDQVSEVVGFGITARELA